MTYLTCVVDMKENKTKLSQLPIIREFPDIFQMSYWDYLQKRE